MLVAERFVVESIDPHTNEVVDEVSFSAEDSGELCLLLEMTRRDLERGASYQLTISDLAVLQEKYGIRLERTTDIAQIRTAVIADALPYKVHTNRELSMMLDGRKPLAAFVEDLPRKSEPSYIPESLFQPYVECGRFMKEEFFLGGEASTNIMRYVLYALPSELWRLHAYKLLVSTVERSGWSEGMERMEGSLLGYEDWQNDAYIALIHRRSVESV